MSQSGLMRPRPIDVDRPIPIFWNNVIDESESALRSVPAMPTGMEAHEEAVSAFAREPLFARGFFCFFFFAVFLRCALVRTRHALFLAHDTRPTPCLWRRTIRVVKTTPLAIVVLCALQRRVAARSSWPTSNFFLFLECASLRCERDSARRATRFADVGLPKFRKRTSRTPSLARRARFRFL